MTSNSSESVNFKKGDRVECLYKGQTFHGAISRVFAGKATMVLDGGKQSLTGPVGSFKASSQPPPADPVSSPADRWSITGFQPFNGRDDCVAFEATLCRDGQPVLRACNNGVQDVDQITPLGDHTRLDVADFSTAIRSWLSANGAPRLSNPVHLWISWYVEKRPFGIPSAVFLKEVASGR